MWTRWRGIRGKENILAVLWIILRAKRCRRWTLVPQQFSPLIPDVLQSYEYQVLSLHLVLPPIPLYRWSWFDAASGASEATTVENYLAGDHYCFFLEPSHYIIWVVQYWREIRAKGYASFAPLHVGAQNECSKNSEHLSLLIALPYWDWDIGMVQKWPSFFCSR